MESDDSNNSAHLPKKAMQQIYSAQNTILKPRDTNLEIGKAVVEENMPSV